MVGGVGERLNGFDVRYTNGDHPTLRQLVDITNVHIDDNTVTVTAKLLLRDNTGAIDDPFRGVIDVVVLADVG